MYGVMTQEMTEKEADHIANKLGDALISAYRVL